MPDAKVIPDPQDRAGSMESFAILKTAESYTYLTFAHPVLKPLPASGRGLERGSILSEVLNRSQYNVSINSHSSHFVFVQ